VTDSRADHLEGVKSLAEIKRERRRRLMGEE
jgi:hypothetical protein